MIALQGVGRDFHAAAADRAVELGQAERSASPFSPVRTSYSDAGGFGQQFEPFRGQRVENDNFGHGSVLRVFGWVRPTSGNSKSGKMFALPTGGGQISLGQATFSAVFRRPWLGLGEEDGPNLLRKLHKLGQSALALKPPSVLAGRWAAASCRTRRRRPRPSRA